MDRRKDKKIVLIGPVYPYKGGIAHYTSLLYRALSQRYDVDMISYKMQYPKFLFKREQKDYQNDVFRVDDAQFLINTANPLNIAGVSFRLKKMHPDLVIMQWWHPYFAPCYRIMETVLGRNIKKMFVCHNVFPHERFPADRMLTKAVLGRADHFLLHSQSDIRELLSICPKAQYILNPHPTYNAFRLRNLTKEQARAELSLDGDSCEKILLFFGFVREYKGLEHLIAAMPQVRRRLGNVRLIIAGTFGRDRDRYLDLIDERQVRDCIRVVDGYIPDNEVERYFAACDVVVLPYESATQSGIIQIAYGFGKPVIATNVGGLPDVVMDGQTGYIVERGDEKQLADAIVKYYQCGMEETFAANVRREAYRFSWDRLAEKVDAVLERCEDG
ncbi:MAG: glycosyltransferase family 4 protein [Lachnospiraceae bacterium]|nr:glycosyltransferase family 4 protein [Lachnospiraceae bacterium]